MTFKNCAPFTNCISRINNTDIDNAHNINIIKNGISKNIKLLESTSDSLRNWVEKN